MSHSGDTPRGIEKRKYYKELYALDRESSDEEDEGRADSLAKLQKQNSKGKQFQDGHSRKSKLPASVAPATGQNGKTSATLPRSVSDTSLVVENRKATPVTRRDSNMPDIEPSSKLAAELMTRQTFGGFKPSSAISKVTGKRKRELPVKLKPEGQQIFKNLHFYFFPNNDTHPARRMRITKSMEFGATWERDWNESVTHVILDKTMPYSTLLKFLGGKEVEDRIVVANEIWPSECVAYRALLDAKAQQFRPIGYEPPVQNPRLDAEKRPVSRGSDQSLKLKPAGRAVISKQPETPRQEWNRTAQTASPESDTGVSPCGSAEPSERPSVASASTEDFEAAIKQARELQHVPLEDEEGDSRPGSSSSSSDAEGRVKTNTKTLTFQEKFQCMQSHKGDQGGGPNAATIAILQQMAEYYAQIGDEWRPRAYRNAIATLRKQSKKITTKAEALALPYVGERLADKIEEIAFTNRLRRLDNARAEPSDKTLQTFMGVYGAGFQQASRWVSQGFTSLDELLERADLNDNQRIGVEHYADFNSRVPRGEVAQHGEIVRRSIQALDPAFEVIVGGSYRRGAKTSGDIDCIITHPNRTASYLRTTVIDKLVPKLFRKGFLKASLAVTSRDDGSKWHGASCLSTSDVWRRIDLLLVPPEEIGAAMIYFTGNDIFNRSLRLLASHKGMRLNQRGLYRDVIRGKGREKITEGTLVEGRDEKRIFEVLGVPWREPHERVC